jgi:uncharacterized RDD family membrane protein YckC
LTALRGAGHPDRQVASAVHKARDVALDTTAQVETPEHVRFDYPLAGPMRRTAAYLIDLMIRLGVLLVIALVMLLVDAATGLDGMSVGAIMVIYFALDWFYYVLFETLRC